MSPWIECSAQEPQKDGTYLCRHSNGYHALGYRIHCKWWYESELEKATAFFRAYDRGEITHWMPLPDLPNASGGSWKITNGSP